MNYYDLILGLIPFALIGLTGILTIGGFTITTAVPIAATASIGLIGHAMFVRAPSTPVRRRRRWTPEPGSPIPAYDPVSSMPPAEPVGVNVSDQ